MSRWASAGGMIANPRKSRRAKNRGPSLDQRPDSGITRGPAGRAATPRRVSRKRTQDRRSGRFPQRDDSPINGSKVTKTVSVKRRRKASRDDVEYSDSCGSAGLRRRRSQRILLAGPGALAPSHIVDFRVIDGLRVAVHRLSPGDVPPVAAAGQAGPSTRGSPRPAFPRKPDAAQ